MKRRDLLQGVLAGVFLLTPLARVVAKTLLEHNGALPAPAAIQRVFAAGPPAAVFLYVLVPEKLLGWPMNLAPAQLAFIHPEQQHLPFVGRLAGRGSTVSLESLLLLAPDVIVDLGNAGVTQRSAAQRLTQQTGIATVQIEGLLAQTPQQLRQAGALLGAVSVPKSWHCTVNSCWRVRYALPIHARKSQLSCILRAVMMA